MGRTRAAAVVAASMLAVFMGGCCGGGTTVEKTVEKTPIQVEQKTAGEQLMDLQKAYESGAITEQQYNKMKQDIIEKSGGK